MYNRAYSYLYIFDYKDEEEEKEIKSSEPKFIVNMNNLISFDVKKDMRVELIENKKSLFSSTKKTLIKANSLDDLEQWVNQFDKIIKNK